MLIKVQPETILTWQEFDRPGEQPSRQELVQKAQQGLWKPEPPIIISPMPQPYCGKYEYFLYNGHTRLSVAQEHNLPLLGKVVMKDENIPKKELIQHGAFGLEAVLRAVICRKLQPHPIIDGFFYFKHPLPYLLEEFAKKESEQDARTA